MAANRNIKIDLKILIIFLFFLLTRVYIWLTPPPQFTEIIYSYMPYAHLWASGVKPYLEQWYEYPPLTIPLFYIPHLIDTATNNFNWHIRYLPAYKGILTAVDVSIFLLVYLTLRKQKIKDSVITICLLYYSIATAKAHHFIYDSMDLAFALGLLISAVGMTVWSGWKGSFLGWLGYFAATALKYVNAPLGLIYAVLERKQWKRVLISGTLTLLIVWGWALVYYRSSLRVSLVYHSQRGLQVESVPAQIAATINAVTKTEEYKEVFKNYDITGPVSTNVKQIFDVLLIAVMGSLGLWMINRAWFSDEIEKSKLRIGFTLLYVFAFMFLAKVLSTPFLLWHIPLLAVYPFRSEWKRYLSFIFSFVMLFISMTKVPNLPVGIFSIHLFIGWIRSVLIMVLWLILLAEVGIKRSKSHS